MSLNEGSSGTADGTAHQGNLKRMMTEIDEEQPSQPSEAANHSMNSGKITPSSNTAGVERSTQKTSSAQSTKNSIAKPLNFKKVESGVGDGATNHQGILQNSN